MTPLSDTERADRARRAEAELRQTDAAFAEVRTAMMERWASTGVGQEATREKMFMGVQVIDAVKRALISRVVDGQILAHSAEMAALLAPAVQDRR